MSYHVLVARVTIGAHDKRRAPLVIRRIVAARGQSSWRQLTATCEVELSRKWYYQEGRQAPISQLVQQGDPIRVEVGWTRRYNLEFVGFVAEPVLDRWPCTLVCEDRMYALKRHSVERSWARVDLHTFLRELLPKGMRFEAPEGTDLGAVIVPRMNMARALEELRMSHGLVAYFRPDGVLRVGRVYLDQVREPAIELNLQRNCLEDSLAYVAEPRLLVRVKSKIRDEGGQLRWVERYSGPTDGDLVSYTRPGVQSAEELQRMADQMRKVAEKPGFKGSVTTYGFPLVAHSQVSRLVNEREPAQNGYRAIDSVSWDFSRAGYRRTLELGIGGPKLTLVG